MEKIFDLKFIVPPVIAIFSVFITDPIKYISLAESYGILLSTTSILVFGFLISTLVNLIINISHKRDTLKEYLEKNGIKTKDENERELISWEAENEYSKKDNGFIANQISKRWDMAIVNFNCSMSLFGVTLWGLFTKKPFYIIDLLGQKPFYTITIQWWWVSIMIFFSIFLCTGIILYKSVKKLDIILYEKMKNNPDRDTLVGKSKTA